MGAVGGLLGVSGGANGTGFASPSTGGVVTPGQLDAANKTAQQALQQQQAFAQQVQPGGQQGVAAQQALLTALQQGAAGQGPNPALAQLNQTTGQNVANQNALMAGQRGAAQNVGLIARQAAQQGAQTQQQAAGQAAIQQAQQQIAYQQMLGQQAGQMVGQQASATGAETQAAQNQQLGLTNAAAGLQSSINAGNTALARTQMQGQQAMIGGLMPSVGSVMSMFAKGGKVQNFDDGGQVQPINVPLSTGPQVDQIPQAQKSKSSGNGPGGLLALLSNGGDPGSAPTVATPVDSAYKGKSKFGAFIKNGPLQAAQPSQAQTTSQPEKSKPAQQTPAQPNYGNYGANKLASGMQGFMQAFNQNKPSPSPDIGRNSTDQEEQYMNANAELQSGGDTEEEYQGQDTPSADNTLRAAEGGRVPAMVSPGEVYLPPKSVKKVAKGADPIKTGEKIPGKPKHPGNDYRNDTVPKDLKEGGIVIPNSILQSKNPHWEALKFVRKTMKKSKK